MYVSKYSQTTKSLTFKKYIQKLQVKIVDFIENNKNEFIGNAMPMYYLIISFDENAMDIYQCIHNLIHDKRIYRVFTSSCPVCGNGNYTSQEYGVVGCSFCNNRYIPESIEENLKILK